jgi:hypothetical protein
LKTVKGGNASGTFVAWQLFYASPSEWLRNKQTKDLAEKVEKAGIPANTSRQRTIGLVQEPTTQNLGSCEPVAKLAGGLLAELQKVGGHLYPCCNNKGVGREIF